MSFPNSGDPFGLTFFHSQPASRTSNAICSLRLNLRTVKQRRNSLNGCLEKHQPESLCVCEARIYVLCVCMQIRVMQLFPALVANTNTHTHTKATAVPAITLWCFGQFVLVGGLFQLQLEFHHKLPYNSPSPFPLLLSTPSDMPVLVVLDAKPQ